MEQLRIDRRLTAATLVVAMGLALLSGCTTHLKQSLTQTVTGFYAQVTSDNNPYSPFDVMPLWPKLPVDAPQVVKAEVGNIADQAVDGEWSVRAHMGVNTGQGMVTMTENTVWARDEDRWVLSSVEFVAAELAAWSDCKEIGAGLLAFEHQGRIWLLDTISGRLTLVASPEDSGFDGDHPLHVADWAPDGSGLLLYTEAAA